MSTTIEQIRKVNVYEEDENGNRTLVQGDVPLGSNVVMENEPPAEELYLLTGKEDTIANTITLYPTKVKVTSGGSIDAKDFTMSGSSVNSNYISTITWGEEKETLEDGTEKVSARRLYYKINNYKIQVKTEDGQNSLNLLQVPYLELYEPNTIKTTKNMAKPLLLNVENVVNNNLANDTKVVLGHTAIKDSSLDLVDNTNGFLRARLGVDMAKNYGYLNFFKTITENNKNKNYEIGSIFTNKLNEFCIMPRKIPCTNINTIDTDNEVKNNENIVVGGSIGTSSHQFRDIWAETLHGNVTPTVYTGAATKEGDKYLKTYTNQLIYIDPSRGNTMKDLPDNSNEGFCFTLSASGTNTKFKQIFLNTEINNDKNKYIYVRTGQTNSAGYKDWHKIGASEWTEISEVYNKFGISKVTDREYYIIPNDFITMATQVIQTRQFLDIYQSYDYKNDFLIHRSINQIKATIDKAIVDYDNDQKKNPNLNQNKNLIACGYIKTKCYVTKNKGSTSEKKRQYVNFIFTYNTNNEICLVGIDDSSDSIINKVQLLRVKQYD